MTRLEQLARKVAQIAKELADAEALLHAECDRLLRAGTHARTPELQAVLDVVAEHWECSVAELLSRARYAPLQEARMLAFATAREITGYSYERLGRAYLRDHGAILAACQRAADLTATEPALARRYQRVLTAARAAIARAKEDEAA